MLTGSSLKKFIVYTIEGRDSLGTFMCHRRYNDFHHLYNSLLSNWPGCFIPPIPKKKSTGNFKEKFVKLRL